MSEELEDASIQLPRAMMLATVLNGVLGIAMMITFCFCILDIDQVDGDGASQFPDQSLSFIRSQHPLSQLQRHWCHGLDAHLLLQDAWLSAVVENTRLFNRPLMH